MTVQERNTLSGHVRDVLLEGGPADVPLVYRNDRGTSEHVKIRRMSGHEHYEFSGAHHDHEGRRLPVFRWVYRTTIAE